MTSEISQFQESNPVINPVRVNSKASGYQNIARVLGQIGERSIAKAEDFASEASKNKSIANPWHVARYRIAKQDRNVPQS